MKTATRLKVFSLGASTSIMIMANTMLLPIFPQMRKALDLSLQEISLMFILVSFPAAFLNPIGGVLADRLGRKKIVVPSIFLYGIAGGLAGVALLIIENPFNTVLVLRVLQGVGSATPMYLAVALAGDIFQSQERTQAMGFLEMANGVGKLLSPIIGGLVGMIGFYAPFFVYPIIAIPVGILFWITIKEPPLKEKVSLKSEIASLKELKSVSNILALLAAFASIFFLFGTMFWVSEFIDQSIPEGTIVHGLVIAIPVAALVLTAYFASSFTTKIGPRITLFAGHLIAGVSLILIPVLYTTVFVWPNLVLLGFSAGLLLPVLDTVASAISSRGHRGVISTIFGSFRCLGAAAAPFLIASLLHISIIVTFLPVAALIIILGFAILFFVNEEKLLPPELKEKE
jgi:MFS transporter, ACDE family, multidrug resistance protein